MNILTLAENGSLIDNGRPVENDPLTFLGSRINLAEGFTLRSYFRMLARYPLLARFNPFSPSQIELYQECDPEGCRSLDFDHLEFGKTVEMIGYPGKPRMEIYNALRRVAKGDASALERSSLSFLLDMPLVLGRLKHVVFGDKVDIFEFETGYTLFEFVDGIAWELSFHGKPMQCEIGR